MPEELILNRLSIKLAIQMKIQEMSKPAVDIPKNHKWKGINFEIIKMQNIAF